MGKKRTNKMNKETKADVIIASVIGGVALVIIAGIVIVVHKKNVSSDSTKTSTEFEGTLSYEEVEEPTIPEEDAIWIPEEQRVYDGVLVNKYKEEYTPYSEEDCMGDFVYKTLDRFIELPEGKDPYNSIREGRGAYLNVIDFGDGYRAIIELEHDEQDASKWYIKAYDNESDNRRYFVITNKKKDGSELEYNTTVEEVDWSSISDKVTKFNEEEPTRLDDRAYCEELVDYYKSQGVGGWEGYSGDLTVDMMMEIRGYTDSSGDN